MRFLVLYLLFLSIAWQLSTSHAEAAFVNPDDIALHNLTQIKKQCGNRYTELSLRIAKYLAAYAGLRIGLNIAFSNEKRLAGIDAAKKLLSLLPSEVGISSKPYVLTFDEAQRRVYENDFFHPGYYIITDVPTVSAQNGKLDRSMFPYSQELFPNMCRLKTSWQSFTVGQTLHPTQFGTNHFCHGQLLWYIGKNDEVHPLALDDHDRQTIFHTWYWMKQIVLFSKFRPGIVSALMLLIKGTLAYRSPSLLPLFLLDKNTLENVGGHMKNLTMKTFKKQTIDNRYEIET